MKITNRDIGLQHPPFIIAEMSGNHNQSIDRAIELVDVAAKSGVDAIKLQTYTANTMTLDVDRSEFKINNLHSPWFNRTLYSLYQEAHTPWEWHANIFEHARKLGIIPFSAPFDNSAIDFLLTLDVPCLKIASFECIDIPLIEKAACTKLPLIISTGMASLVEITEAVTAARDCGNKELALLKCTTTYPAEAADSNLATIPHMRELFKCEVGLSDHTLGIGTAITGVTLGASMIEKHFTISRADGGVDALFSLEPSELNNLVIEAKNAQQSIGTVHYGPTKGERSSLTRRRSLYITQDMKEGDTLSKDNLRSIRPGGGIKPKFMKQVLGKKVLRSVKSGTPLNWDLLIQ